MADEKSTIPTKARLEMMLIAAGADAVYPVEQLIKQYKLPFFVTQDNETGVGTLCSQLSQGEQFLEKFTTVNKDMLLMKEKALKAARSPYEVLITGESGTGKEIIANSMIFDRKGPIKTLNCAGFPEALIESELFGHVKGSFTGANNDKQGLMSAAQGGILFLDEIGDMPPIMQPKLLRAIQYRTIRKVGSNVDEKIDCKFVFATHRNLKKLAFEDRFRLDLYARISTLELHISPLKDRIEDVIPIIESSVHNGKKFVERFRAELNQGRFDLSLNVRSLQQHVIRYDVFGTIEMI